MDINDQEIADQLKEQGLIYVSRIMSKSKQATSLLKAEAIDQDTYKICIQNKIKIGYIRCHTEPLRTVLKCFKCQKIGLQLQKRNGVPKMHWKPPFKRVPHR